MIENRLFKVLKCYNGVLTSPYARKPWPVKIGEWTPYRHRIAVCSSGWHLFQSKDFYAWYGDYNLGNLLFLAEGKKDCRYIIFHDKIVFARCRLLADVTPEFSFNYWNQDSVSKFNKIIEQKCIDAGF